MKNIIRKIPSEGNVNTIFKRLSEYILPMNNEWTSNIKPASQHEIDRLISLSQIKNKGFDIPKEYLEYLRYMGAYDGDLLSYMLHADTSIKKLIEWYEEYAIDDPEEIHPDKLIFAVTEMDAEFYINLKEDKKHIITTSADRIYKVDGFSQDFEKLLFQSAYRIYERKYFEQVLYFGTNIKTLDETLKKLDVDDIFEIVDKYVEEYGFEKAWFSDKWNYIAFKGDTSFFIQKRVAISGFMVGSNREEVRSLAILLNNLLGTEIQ